MLKTSELNVKNSTFFSTCIVELNTYCVLHSYIETVEKEQLQLALALSASIGQVCSDEDRKLKQLIDTEKGSVGKRPKKR